MRRPTLKEIEGAICTMQTGGVFTCKNVEDFSNGYHAGIQHALKSVRALFATIPELQQRVTDWATRCFGRDHVFNQRVRALRLLEEAVEFAQAVDVPADRCHKLTDFVYSRPVGNPAQELGGVGVVLLTCASAVGVDLDTVIENEVIRIESKPAWHFAQRNQAKCDAGFDEKSGA